MLVQVSHAWEVINKIIVGCISQRPPQKVKKGVSTTLRLIRSHNNNQVDTCGFLTDVSSIPVRMPDSITVPLLDWSKIVGEREG